MPHQNQAEYDRAVAEIADDPRIAAFRTKVLALFPAPGWSVPERFCNGNHVFVWVNGCTVGWKPGTPADYVVGMYIPGYNYNGGGKTVEGAIRRAEEAFDDHVMEFTSRILARAFGNDMNGWRAPYRVTKWDD